MQSAAAAALPPASYSTQPSSSSSSFKAPMRTSNDQVTPEFWFEAALDNAVQAETLSPEAATAVEVSWWNKTSRTLSSNATTTTATTTARITQPSFAFAPEVQPQAKTPSCTRTIYLPKRDPKTKEADEVLIPTTNIEAEMNRVGATLSQMEESLWFQNGSLTFSTFHAMSSHLVNFLSSIAAQNAPLTDRRKEVSVIKNDEIHLIPIVLEAIQGRELSLLDLNRRTQVLQSTVLHHVTDKASEWELWKAIKGDYVTAVTSAGTQNAGNQEEQIRKIEMLWEKIASVSKNPVSLSTVNTLRICTVALPLSLLKKVEPVSDHLKSRFSELQGKVTAMLNEMKNRALADPALLVLAGVTPITDDAFKQFISDESVNGNFAFAKKVTEAVGGFIMKWTVGLVTTVTDPNEKALAIANSLTEVARALLKLRKAVQSRIEEIAQGDISVVIAVNYKNIARKCYDSIDTLMNTLGELAASDKIPDVFTYAAGLRNCLLDTCYSIQLLDDMSEENSLKLSRVLANLKEYLFGQSPSLNDLNSDAGSFPLFFAAAGLDPFVRLGDAYPRADTVDMLRETIAKLGPKGLELSDSEERVWATVFGSDTLEKLQDKNGKLLHQTISFIQKRICKLMYFSSKDAMEQDVMELELVLDALKKSPAFDKTKRENRNFGLIVDAYEASDIKPELSALMLQRARKVCEWAHKASNNTDSRSVYHYARAWQYYHDFNSLPEDKSKNTFNSMRKFIYTKLRYASEECCHVLPSKRDVIDVINQPLAEFAAMDDISLAIKGFKNDERQGIFLRALSCGIYSTNDSERSDAQKIVRAYLNEGDDFFNSLKGDIALEYGKKSEKGIIDLICELTLQQIIKAEFSQIAPRGLSLFMEGPLNAYLQTKCLVLSKLPIAAAIWNLLHYEKGLDEEKRVATKSTLEVSTREEVDTFIDSVALFTKLGAR